MKLVNQEPKMKTNRSIGTGRHDNIKKHMETWTYILIDAEQREVGEGPHTKIIRRAS